jgi:hypothetical protein
VRRCEGGSLTAQEGIAVYPDELDFPGLRFLRLTIDGRRLRVGLRTSPPWWPF